ncbi:MAG: tetratricopeptide repeat protein [Alphaproteobacteria bacterium]|nr:tetratricopeptide repeat protein [Alphaproteobacteria bacterium]
MVPPYRAQLDTALALLGDGRLGEARARLSRLSRNHPGEPEIGLHLAGALHAAGRHTEALPVFLTVLDRFPDLSVAAVGLSRVWRELGETENAKKILLRYITKSPENPTLLAELAGLWHFEHEFETAI